MSYDIEIIFFNNEKIYVKQTTTGQWTLFHRFFAPKGSYNRGWRQFRHLLLYEWRHLDYEHCYRLAFRWDIQSQRVAKGPDLINVKTQERSKK